MKLLIILLITKATLQAQTNVYFNNANVKMHNGSKLTVFGSVLGKGSLDIQNSEFRAKLVACEILVNKDDYSLAYFTQKCTIKAYDMTGKYLGTYKDQTQMVERLRSIRMRQNTPILITSGNKYLRKVFIKR